MVIFLNRNGGPLILALHNTFTFGHSTGLQEGVCDHDQVWLDIQLPVGRDIIVDILRYIEDEYKLAIVLEEANIPNLNFMVNWPLGM